MIRTKRSKDLAKSILMVVAPAGLAALAVVLGIVLLVKLTALVLWHCIAHPRSTSVIDYEKNSVYLKRKSA